jgi:hypothetical protein
MGLLKFKLVVLHVQKKLVLRLSWHFMPYRVVCNNTIHLTCFATAPHTFRLELLLNERVQKH